MSKTLKISLGVLFVAILIFAGIYAKFNMSDDVKTPENKIDTYKVETETDLNDLYNSNQLDKIIEKKKNAKELNDLIILAQAYLQKGSLEFKEKEYGQKGLDMANRILELNKNSVIGYSLKGYAYEIMEDYKEALKAYEKSLEIEKSFMTLNQIGHVYDLMGDDKKSREYYKLASEISPNDVNVKMNLARVAYEDKKYSEALEGFKYVYNNELNSRRKAEAAYMISQIYLSEKLSNDKLAEDFALKSKNADPSYPMGWSALGQMSAIKAFYDKKSDFDKEVNNAVKYYNKAIELYSNQTEVHLQKARLMFILNDKDESAKSYKDAINSVKKDITLMDDDRVEFEKFIKDEIKLRKIKISRINGEYIISKIIKTLTFPSNVEAACTGYWGTNRVCSTRAEALAIMKAANNMVGNNPNSPHYFTLRDNGRYAACANGATIKWKASCGNGIVEDGEKCDEGEGNGRPGHCNKTCGGTTPICGNGIVEDGEKCDDRFKNGEPGFCNEDCTGVLSKCGTEKNVCLRGKFFDSVDTQTLYKWECRGSSPADSVRCTSEKCISDWQPPFNASSVCQGYVVTQTDGCGLSRTMRGIKSCHSYYCRNSVGEDIRYNGTKADKARKCPTDDDLTEPTDDDLTEPTDDDLTGITEEEFCKINPEECITTASGDLALDIYWSTDKIHWFDDFDKLIQLKSRGEKVYVKNDVIGKCTSKVSPIGLFKFNLLNTNTLGGSHKYLRKIDAYMYQGNALFSTKPTSDAPISKVFNQDLKVEYCGSVIKLDRTLNVKISDIDREEI